MTRLPYAGRDIEGGGTLSRPGALRLAEKLRSHWQAKGYNVAVEVTKESLQLKGKSNTVWIVRSSLLGGRPPPPADCASNK